MKYFKYLLALAIVVIVAFYAFALNVLNPEPVALKLMPSIEYNLRASTFLIGSFASGLILGAFLVWLALLGQKFKTGRAKRQLEKAEKEVQGLRSATMDQA